MEVILLKKVAGLGNLGDKLAVRSGYGRNFLIPQGLAAPATATNLAAFEQRRAELERGAADALAAAEARKASLAGLVVRIARKAGDGGRLFGSIGAADVAIAISETGTAVTKTEVRLPQGPLRAVGEFDVDVHLHADVDTSVRVEVIPAN